MTTYWDKAWWQPEPQPAAPITERRSQYVSSYDGTRLAVDVHLPTRPIADGARVPTILLQTRYIRRNRYQPWAEPLSPILGRASDVTRYNNTGYAVVVADVRGTGASFGSRPVDMPEEEQLDRRALVEWVCAQPWSDGTVGVTGISYEGGTAEHTIRHGLPEVRAAIVQYAVFDGYDDVLRPGGLFNRAFFTQWSGLCASKDANAEEEWLRANAVGPYQMAATLTDGVAPVDEDEDDALLRQAVAEHEKNSNLLALLSDGECRDTVSGGRDLVSPAHCIAELQAAPTAVYSWCGWYDGAYPHSAVKRWAALRDNGCRLLLGPWNHGGSQQADPTHLGSPTFDALGEMLRFLDHHVRGLATGIEDEPPVHYFTVGEGAWKAAQQWPPPGFDSLVLHAGPDGRLSEEGPGTAGVDTYLVDRTATSGINSRWSQMSHAGPVVNDVDRADEDAKLLVYNSDPLPTDVEITGHPVARVFLECDRSDTMVKAYLEEVTASGRVLHITEGQLRASHRKLGEAPYETFAPWHTHSSADVQPLQPGEVVELTFGLLPISYLVRAGSRIRLALAGADDGIFDHVPADGPAPTWRVHRSLQHPTRIDVPVQWRDA